MVVELTGGVDEDEDEDGVGEVSTEAEDAGVLQVEMGVGRVEGVWASLSRARCGVL